MNLECVAGIVCQIKGGVPLILTYQPVQSTELADFRVTTVTGVLESQQNGFSAMAKAVQHCLGVERSRIIKERPLVGPLESIGKQYRWYFILLHEDADINPRADEIQKLSWNQPAQLEHSLKQMSEGRRNMFLHALTEACKQNLLNCSDFSFLPPPYMVVEMRSIDPKMA